MKKLLFPVLLFGLALFLLTGCGDDPERENVPELVTKIVLTFSPAAGGTPIVVVAVDPDGEGPQDLQPSGPITLAENTPYELKIELYNELLNPGEEGYDLTEEIEEEADEHQFFFRFTEGAFSSPTGSGNIKDNLSTPVGPVNYLDQDQNSLPLGLRTEWVTAGAQTGSLFRILLKHQPGVKSDISTSLDGETDVDVSFALNIVN